LSQRAETNVSGGVLPRDPGPGPAVAEASINHNPLDAATPPVHIGIGN
jgi:hypothetical protein